MGLGDLPFSHICWCYLKFTAELWNLQEIAFAEIALKNEELRSRLYISKVK